MTEVREASLEMKKPKEEILKPRRNEEGSQDREPQVTRQVKQEATDELEEELLNEENEEGSEETTVISETDDSARNDSFSAEERMETE